MTRLRRVLGSLVMAGLLFQAATVALAAAESLHDTNSPSTVCTCPHGPGDGHGPAGSGHGMCPMHRTDTGVAKCRIQGTQPDTSAVLLSLLSVVAVPAESDVTLAAPPVSATVCATLSHPIDPVFSPDSPPPRA